MHLNKNTTLELIDNSSQSMSVRKHLSPFSVKQQRKKFVEERGQVIQAQILQQYKIEPYKPPANMSGQHQLGGQDIKHVHANRGIQSSNSGTGDGSRVNSYMNVTHTADQINQFSP